LLAAVPAPEARGEDLNRFIERAVAGNRDYLASLQRVREAEALLRQAGLRPAPTLGAEAGSTRLLGNPDAQEYSLEYGQTIETGNKRSKRIGVAQLGLELVKAEAEERKRQLALEVRERVADFLNAARRLEVLAELRRINSETLRLLAARVKEGDAAPLEKQLLEAEVNRSEAERITTEARLAGAMLQLKRLGAIQAGDAAPRGGGDPPVLAPVPDLVKTALATRPDLRSQRLAADQARSGVELARAEASPNISASIRYAYRSSSLDQFGLDRGGALTPIRDRENLLTVGVSLPLFTSRRSRPAVEASQSRDQQARLRLEYLASAIPAEVEAAHNRATAAKQALDVFDKVLVQSEANLGVIRQAWELGQLRFLDVLNEQRRLTELRLTRADAEAELMRAAAELAYAVGGDVR
jgi:cobalt-zinc-cadmium efflux system outer membrane protein